MHSSSNDKSEIHQITWSFLQNPLGQVYSLQRLQRCSKCGCNDKGCNFGRESCRPPWQLGFGLSLAEDWVLAVVAETGPVMSRLLPLNRTESVSDSQKPTGEFHVIITYTNDFSYMNTSFQHRQCTFKYSVL